MGKDYVEESWRTPIQDMEAGDTFKTRSRVITRSEVELFALLGGDVHPMFLSRDAARENGWKDQLVPGLCALNIGYGLLIQAGFLKDVMAYMGTDHMRFLKPVYPGDAIRMETEVTGKKQTAKGWICEYDWRMINQDETLVAHGHNT